MRYLKMKKILTQVGTLNSLMMGDYYATETVDELLKNGDIVLVHMKD